MKKTTSMSFGLLPLVFTGLLIAAPVNSHHQLLEKVIQCKATREDMQDLNEVIDQKKIAFPESKTVTIWGGKAWDVNPPVSFGGITSGVIVLPTRTSLYLRVKAPSDVHAVMRGLAKNMNVPAQSSDRDTDYLTDTSPRRTHILASDEKDVYWVGCSYDALSKPWR